ncbi:thiamine pyrophosphate-dependent enzyme [Desulfococcaceae bacterium HSG8]|nr:thiamine pyrophosphate-dependent enzyme [Desulfococcaceae bacterium HSG8]
MDSLLNKNRPPVFCPGCSHDRILHALDKSFQNMGLSGNQIAMVSDIGCSGLFDTFFNTHALHGLHGRALTYAAGLKMARPDLHVVVTMGDGGLGIGGAHLLSACRRNLDITLLILNNFNFGMTGGQFSATTPQESMLSSGFLNSLEKPMDPGSLAAAAGAPFVTRSSAYQKDLSEVIEQAIRFEGFSLIDIRGICPGRYLRRNRLTPKMIEESIGQSETLNGPVPQNIRPEYGASYREHAGSMEPVSMPEGISPRFTPEAGRQEVIILGSAGQRILTAGEILGIAGLTAGLNVTQKNDYNITVLVGPSVSELILSPEKIDYTGITDPTVVIVLAAEGVARRKAMFDKIGPETLIIKAADVDIPATRGTVISADFKDRGIKKQDRALASLALLSGMNQVLTSEMLDAALEERFKEKALNEVRKLVAGIKKWDFSSV